MRREQLRALALAVGIELGVAFVAVMFVVGTLTSAYWIGRWTV